LVSYVAALFKELQFQAGAAEMVEAAKPEIPALIMIGSKLYYALPSAEVDCRLFVIFNPGGRPTIAREPRT
jgi:hypothetical protein